MELVLDLICNTLVLNSKIRTRRLMTWLEDYCVFGFPVVLTFTKQSPEWKAKVPKQSNSAGVNTEEACFIDLIHVHFLPNGLSRSERRSRRLWSGICTKNNSRPAINLPLRRVIRKYQHCNTINTNTITLRALNQMWYWGYFARQSHKFTL